MADRWAMMPAMMVLGAVLPPGVQVAFGASDACTHRLQHGCSRACAGHGLQGE